jgi:tRNA dimethylallyltransferase
MQAPDRSSLPHLLAIVGPTASGKTPLSLLVAERLNGEIVSADSRQIYRHLDVGTAKPTREQRASIPHHIVDMLEPSEEYTAGIFGKEARDVIVRIVGRGKVPIVVGGSGLYVRAVIDGLFEGPGKDPELRSQLEEKLRALGPDALLEELRRVDPRSAVRMTTAKPRPVIRALEVYYATGKPLSEFHAEQRTQPPFHVTQVGLVWERQTLYARINERVDRMVERGLVAEVQRLLQSGYDERLNSLNSVGYKEIISHLRGEISLERAVEQIKQNTRNFAKRQMTWFRTDQRIDWLTLDADSNLDEVARAIAESFLARTKESRILR